jgi:polyisoprenoid-binding protein YceI
MQSLFNSLRASAPFFPASSAVNVFSRHVNEAEQKGPRRMKVRSMNPQTRCLVLLFSLLSLWATREADSITIFAENRKDWTGDRTIHSVPSPLHERTAFGTSRLAPVRYRIDAGQSRFLARAYSGGLLWFKGHDHFIAIRDFSGEAKLDSETINPAKLQIRARADSLEESRDEFTDQQKQIINKELREIVFETSKYPEISFNSTDVKVTRSGNQIQAQIEGDLTMHGVTRRVVIPALVTRSGNDLRASGTFAVKRSDYNIKATSALHGMIRVRDKVKLTFDIVAHQE